MSNSIRKSKIKYYYIVSDVVTIALCWSIFYSFRKWYIEPNVFGYSVPLHLGLKYAAGVIGYVSLLIFIYYSSGYYNSIFRNTKLEEFFITLFNSFIGVSLVFFLVILDDVIVSYKNYYQSFFFLFSLQITASLFSRFFITQYIKYQIKKGKITCNTIIIGKIEVIGRILDEFQQKFPRHGHSFIGYIPVEDSTIDKTYGIPKIGKLEDIYRLVHRNDIDDVMVLLKQSNNQYFNDILNELNSADINLFVNPELYNTLKRRVELAQLFQGPLIKVSRELLTPWQKSIKKISDILLAIAGLILSLPIAAILAIAIKLGSKGPVLYYHERIGQYEKPFKILKFRSMYNNAEEDGPQLSSENDPRVTPIGKFMRRLRLDEIPNLINVLKGEMSFVGPRPERRFYIDQIHKTAPEYNRLFQVKPGVTSLGQVKFGYAKNVEEMIKRMQYDLFYIENISLLIDFEIIFRTINTIFKGKGF